MTPFKTYFKYYASSGLRENLIFFFRKKKILIYKKNYINKFTNLEVETAIPANKGAKSRNINASIALASYKEFIGCKLRKLGEKILQSKEVVMGSLKIVRHDF